MLAHAFVFVCVTAEPLSRRGVCGVRKVTWPVPSVNVNVLQVRTTHADHTLLMAPVAAAVGKRAEELLALQPPSPVSCLWASTVAGWEMDNQRTIGHSEYWRQGVVQGVDFPRAVETVLRAHAAAADAADAERGGAAAPRRSLHFVEMGEGMLTRFCRDLPCISLADAELKEKMIFSHLLARKEKQDKAALAREIESVIEDVEVPTDCFGSACFLSYDPEDEVRGDVLG